MQCTKCIDWKCSVLLLFYWSALWLAPRCVLLARAKDSLAVSRPRPTLSLSPKMSLVAASVPWSSVSGCAPLPGIMGGLGRHHCQRFACKLGRPSVFCSWSGLEWLGPFCKLLSVPCPCWSVCTPHGFSDVLFRLQRICWSGCKHSEGLVMFNAWNKAVRLIVFSSDYTACYVVITGN